MPRALAPGSASLAERGEVAEVVGDAGVAQLFEHRKVRDGMRAGEPSPEKRNSVVEEMTHRAS